jgi:hypothetical protein
MSSPDATKDMEADALEIRKRAERELGLRMQ